MKRLVVICIAVLMMAGCCILPEAIPPSERKGRLYWYTRNAFEGEGHRVRLVGWPLQVLSCFVGETNGGSWPNPGPIELLFALSMVPVMMVDPLVVTPAIDTAFVPYDLYHKHRAGDGKTSVEGENIKRLP